MSPGETADAEARFREELDSEDGWKLLRARWPRAPSAWRTHGTGTSFHLCLYCDEPFRRRGKRILPRFCSRACQFAAQRVRGAYREDVIRELFAEGASDLDMVVETGLSKNVVRQKCYRLGLGAPRKQRVRR